MAGASVDFDAADLAAQLDALSDRERDTLPFGVILLDREGVVRFYSETELRYSKYPGPRIGVNFFQMAKRQMKDELWHHDPARHGGGRSGRPRFRLGRRPHRSEKQYRLRVVSANNGGVWLAFERDEPPDEMMCASAQRKASTTSSAEMPRYFTGLHQVRKLIEQPDRPQHRRNSRTRILQIQHRRSRSRPFARR